VHFVCVGNGPEAYASDLENQANEAGLGKSIHWAGARQDMPDIYNTIDLATLTSYGEGFPNTIGEAMACGKRCVVTDVGDCRMLVGSTGIVQQAGDYKGIAKAWIEMLEATTEQRKKNEKACRDRIVDHFSVSAMVNAYSTFYRQEANWENSP